MTQKTLLYIGNKLTKHGNTATSIETLGSFLELEGYVIFYASSKKNKILRLLDMVLKTLKYSRQVDYVLIDTYSTQNFWYAFIISQMCRFLRLKYITKLHGGNLPDRLKYNPYLCKLIFKNAYKVTAPSNYLLEAFTEKGYKNLLYIPNTIEIGNYKFLKRTVLHPKLLWVRSFAAIYNPMMAIKVLSNLKANFPNAELCMIGPDKENLVEECKKFAKSLNVEVTFKGKLSKEEWTDLSKDYSIFINTTHFDNTPVSVIEAMALGLPIISTNVGGIPYLLKHKINALLVNDNDSLTMSVAVNELINNTELSTEISSNARKLVENYDWEIVKLMWFEILK
jgi:glycosyltransferase involved in cell wall biosynthesis